MQQVCGRDICDAWEQSIKLLLNPTTEVVAAPSALLTLRICDLVLHVERVDPEPPISNFSIWDTQYVSEYSDAIIGGSPGDHKLRDRMLEALYDGKSQLDFVRDELSSDPFTRRAILIFWDPRRDCFEPHPSGLVYLQLFRQGKSLNMAAYFRSNDAWTSALPDMYALTRFLRHESELADLTAGSYTQVVADYHLYQPDYAYAVTRFRKNEE